MNNSFKPEDKIILALDRMGESELFLLIEKLPNLIWVKVGLELFTLLGPEVVYKLRNLGKKVFLDLKFHDIPSTMARASFQAAKTGAELITVHASAGKRCLQESNFAAIEGAQSVGLPPPCLLAVTVLTSWSSKDFVNELGIQQSISNRVNFLAELAYKSGIGGCVCSPLEVEGLRTIFPDSFKLITPGIRSSLNQFDDQARVMTPLQALKAGSSKLVLGREITLASNPQDVFNNICLEIA